MQADWYTGPFTWAAYTATPPAPDALNPVALSSISSPATFSLKAPANVVGGGSTTLRFHVVCPGALTGNNYVSASAAAPTLSVTYTMSPFKWRLINVSEN
jgi:hypothetical protein